MNVISENISIQFSIETADAESHEIEMSLHPGTYLAAQ